jgi:hypothetical protein
MLSTNVNNKKCAPKFIFFNEKKNQKDLDDFAGQIKRAICKAYWIS